jgi:hypothetical protein
MKINRKTIAGIAAAAVVVGGGTYIVAAPAAAPLPQAATKNSQKAHKLVIDGIIGPKTWVALRADPQAVKPVAPLGTPSKPPAPPVTLAAPPAPVVKPSVTPTPPAPAVNPATPAPSVRLASANGGTFTPLSDAAAAALVTPAPERIAANATANATPGPANPADVKWGPWASQMGAYLTHVDGHYTGTTDEILSWAAHKWGLSENWVKAEAVAESSWRQSTVGDDGASQGILQVRASQGVNAAANDGWGGYPWTHNSTALAADFQCAYIRWVFDGHFSSYGGQTVAQVAAAHGWDYVMWGALGSWYSGAWYTSDAQQYISSVQGFLNSKAWLQMP